MIYLRKFLKANIMFLFGVIFGAVIATITTVSITMGTYGISETVLMYNNSLCGV